MSLMMRKSAVEPKDFALDVAEEATTPEAVRGGRQGRLVKITLFPQQRRLRTEVLVACENPRVAGRLRWKTYPLRTTTWMKARGMSTREKSSSC
jgi:hypothetical protein